MPFNGASINLFLRQMRDMSEITLGAYIVFAMLVAYAPFVVVVYGLDYLKSFDSTDWMICVLLGFTSSSMQLAKSKSLKYEEPARLAVLNYF
jgi:drug/metabolite transporter (DMT)-like permease